MSALSPLGKSHAWAPGRIHLKEKMFSPDFHKGAQWAVVVLQGMCREHRGGWAPRPGGSQ